MEDRTQDLLDAMKRVLNGHPLKDKRDSRAFDVNGKIDLHALLKALQEELDRAY